MGPGCGDSIVDPKMSLTLALDWADKKTVEMNLSGDWLPKTTVKDRPFNVRFVPPFSGPQHGANQRTLGSGAGEYDLVVDEMIGDYAVKIVGRIQAEASQRPNLLPAYRGKSAKTPFWQRWLFD
jgi:hypothetical protein